MNQDAHKIIVQYILHQKRFTLSDVIRDVGVKRQKALRILEKIKNEGYLSELKDERIPPLINEVGPPRRNPQYKVIGDLSLRKPNRPVCERDKLWRTLRYLHKATRSDLMRLTGCSLGTAERYTKLLEKHKYVRSIGRRSKEKVWFLINDIGPKKPIIHED